MQNNTRLNYPQENTRISLACLLLAGIFAAILGFLPLLPSIVTQAFRPIFVGFCIIFPNVYRRAFSAETKALLFYLLYYTLIFLFFPITKNSFMTWASIALFVMFFAFATIRRWTKKEIMLIFNITAILCTFFAATLYRYNPDMFHAQPWSGYKFFSTDVNDNTAAFAIVPGALSSLILLAYTGKSLLKKAIYLVCAATCFLIVFAIGSRSAFFSMLTGSALIVWQKTREIRNANSRLAIRALFIIAVVLTLVVGATVTEGTHSARLFNAETLLSGNGREELADEAWPLIHEKPIFGGGYDYWTNSGCNALGTHNTFLTTMVQGGYVGLIFFLVFWGYCILRLLQTRNLIPLALVIEAMLHTCTESNMNYYVYIPLILAFILVRYSEENNVPIRLIFGKSY